MARKTARTSDHSPGTLEDPSHEVIIAKHGDICLEIRDQTTGVLQRFCCLRSVLRNASEYFNVLLDPAKFSEGIAIEEKLHMLCRRYDGLIPTYDLPSLVIADIGDLPKTSVSTNVIVKLFLRILHDASTPWPFSRSQSVNIVALLAIVADKFAAHVRVATYLKNQMLDMTLLKDRKSTTAYRIELANRQRLLAGIIFGFSQWVLQYSAALIIEGSKRWRSPYLESGEEAEKDDDNALWWKLPNGVEEELLCRREYVLETLSSIQKHFIALYTSRQPQCRLGYGSSPNCDSYQLGEIIRFLSRKDLLRVESTFAADPEASLEPYAGDIDEIIAKLKECPSYQIDHNHSHCGLRTRLMPILDSLLPRNSVWICLECWRTEKSKESWLESPQGAKWEWHKKPPSGAGSGCQAHREAKAMYTAATREWTPV